MTWPEPTRKDHGDIESSGPSAKSANPAIATTPRTSGRPRPPDGGWPNHDAFCRAEGWRLVRDARGRTGTHHVTYELDLPDGRILRTRISHPPDRTGYGSSLWRHILRDQLHVSEDEFWGCVRDDVHPDRGGPAVPSHALPADLVHLLIARVGLSEAEVAAMSKDEAVARLQQYWQDGT